MVLTMEDFRTFEPVRDTFALFGWPVEHTMSPTLHGMLFSLLEKDADYIAVAVPEDGLAEALKLAAQKLCGINLTIPHKKAVIPLLDEVDKGALDLGAVNTVAFRDGRAIGYNTDILGFAESLKKDGIKLRGKKTLLLGYGGAAAGMGYHCVREGAHLYITGRNLEKAGLLRAHLQSCFPAAKIEAVSRRRIPKDIQIIVNGTPLGMTPHEEKKPLYFLPHKVEYLFDAIYNPPVTALMKLTHSRSRHAVTRDGTFMLVMQGVHAEKIWFGAQFTDIQTTTILRRVYGMMAAKRLHEVHGKRNIALCGFMGAGKTTAGRKLARMCGMEFYDADVYLEERAGKAISEIFAEQGEEAFRRLETDCLLELAAKKNCVIALGGGAVLRPENVEAIKSSSYLIHLDTPLGRIIKNLSYSTSRPLLEKGDKNAEIRKLYHARKDIYRSVADTSVRSVKISTLVESIMKSI